MQTLQRIEPLTRLMEQTGAVPVDHDLYEVQGPGIVAVLRLSALRELSELIEHWRSLSTLPYIDRNEFRWCCRLRTAMRDLSHSFRYVDEEGGPTL